MGKTRKLAAGRGNAKSKPCPHTHANFEQIRNRERIFVMGCYAIFGGRDPYFGYGEHREIVGAHCADCGERLPLGPSNDDPSEVQVEMRAAELSLSWDPSSGPISDEEYIGWSARHRDDVALNSDERLAGWLSREIRYADTERDATAWPWSADRPLAGQYEEHLVRSAVMLDPVPDPNALAAVAMAGTDGLLPANDLDALEYEATRDAEPDCRDEDGPEVERIMAEMEHRERNRLTAAEAADCAALSDSDVCQACGDKWTVHGQTCSGSVKEVRRG